MPDVSGLTALDVFIGLAFVYFILSVVLSSVTEAISAVLNVRWNKLEQGLREELARGRQESATGANSVLLRNLLLAFGIALLVLAAVTLLVLRRRKGDGTL